MNAAAREFGRAVAVVEDVIAQLGIDPASARVRNEPGEACFTLKRGSAAVLITISQRAGESGAFLRVASPLMSLPSEITTRNALYKRLLELNASSLVGCAFGLIGERIVVTSERPTAGLDVGEAQQIIRNLSHVADAYDDRLQKEFGGSGNLPKVP